MFYRSGDGFIKKCKASNVLTGIMALGVVIKIKLYSLSKRYLTTNEERKRKFVPVINSVWLVFI